MGGCRQAECQQKEEREEVLRRQEGILGIGRMHLGIPEMGHVHINVRQHQVYMLQPSRGGYDRRAYQQYAGQNHYPLHQGGHADGIETAQDGVGHDYHCSDDQSPLIGDVKEPGQYHADGDVLAHQVDYGYEDADYSRGAANAPGAVEAMGEVVLHCDIAGLGRHGMHLGSEEQYAYGCT